MNIWESDSRWEWYSSGASFLIMKEEANLCFGDLRKKCRQETKTRGKDVGGIHGSRCLGNKAATENLCGQAGWRKSKLLRVILSWETMKGGTHKQAGKHSFVEGRGEKDFSVWAPITGLRGFLSVIYKLSIENLLQRNGGRARVSVVNGKEDG